MPEDSLQSLGRYNLHAELGQGGFATVYRATDTVLEREVALKVLKPGWTDDAKAVERFMREAKQASRLKHPNIVTIYDVGQAEGRLFIAMELVQGRSLQQIIAEDGALPWSRVLAILEQSAAALDYAHAEGLVHRDIKPANIILDESMSGSAVHVMLTDFGLVRGAEQASLTMGSTGGLIGTPEYIAPEIWNGEPATKASDIYALGCVAFYLLTGQVLFSATTPMAVLKRHAEGPVFPQQWPSGVPSGVKAVLRRTLAKESNRRPESGSEFMAQLRACEGPGIIEAGAAVPVAQRAVEERQRQEAATGARPAAAEPEQQPATIVTQPVAADKAEREAKEKAQGTAAVPIAAAERLPSSSPKSRRWIWLLAGLIAAFALVVIGLIASGGRPSGPPNMPVTPTTAIAGLPLPVPASSTPPLRLTQSAPPTPGITPTPTFTPAPTNTPTLTPIPTATGTGPNGCQLNATFIADVTIPDGTQLVPDQQFVKTWRVRNGGNCQWDAGYQLVFSSGDQMSGPVAVNIPTAGPGQAVDISVNLAAPATAGSYKGNWSLRASNGEIFRPLFVQINVFATPTPPPTLVPPTPPPLSLPFMSDESGWVTQGGQVGTGSDHPPQAGDFNNNAVVRGFLSFDLTSIPGNATVQSARLILPKSAQGIGDVFPNFGSLTFEAVWYGLSLNPQAFDSPGYLVLQNAYGPSSVIGVTAGVAKAIQQGYKRFQIRFSFALGTNNNNSSDIYWIPDAPSLEIVYTVP